MKFYRNKNNEYCYWDKIIDNKLTVIYFSHNIWFFKNGKLHNSKNAAYIRHDGYKQFCLNGTCYGFEYHFNKESWRKFSKLKAFL